jgi:DNA-binding transcriptional MerR regulator
MEGRLHTIGEVAKLTGAPVKTIRYYSDIGLLPPAKVSDSRYRLYELLIAALRWRMAGEAP